MFKKSAAAVISLMAISLTADANPITSASDPALLGATLETFDSAAIGDYTSLAFADLTLTSNRFAMDSGSNGQYVPLNPSGDVFVRNYFSTITFTFDFQVSAFGFVLGATNAVQTLTAFDEVGNVIETLSIADQVGNLPFPYSSFYGLSSGFVNIQSFSLTSNNEFPGFGDIWVLDDLRYVAAATVPEPASLALLGLGLASLGVTRRRKHKLAG